MPNFFLQGESWDIVGMGFSKVPKVLGYERLVFNPLGVNEWVNGFMGLSGLLPFFANFPQNTYLQRILGIFWFLIIPLNSPPKLGYCWDGNGTKTRQYLEKSRKFHLHCWDGIDIIDLEVNDEDQNQVHN